jgi:hypothetical protein
VSVSVPPNFSRERRKRGPAPRWRNPRTPAKTIVHVNTHKIKENQKQNLQQPVITVKKRCDPSLISLSTLDAATVATLGNADLVARKSQNVTVLPDASSGSCCDYVNLYGHEVEILGGCRVVYRPNASKCGAKVWIETLYDVKVICWD